jgi:PDZ domain
MSGDVIASVDGAPIKDAAALSKAIASIAPGTSVKLGVLRAGKERTITVALSELPGPPPAASRDRGATPKSSLKRMLGWPTTSPCMPVARPRSPRRKNRKASHGRAECHRSRQRPLATTPNVGISGGDRDNRGSAAVLQHLEFPDFQDLRRRGSGR